MLIILILIKSLKFFIGAGHNDVELHAAYLDRLRLFIETELIKNGATGVALIKKTSQNSSTKILKKQSATKPVALNDSALPSTKITTINQSATTSN